MGQGINYSVIVPVFNEEDVIHYSYQRLTSVLESTGAVYELLFVNDGSSDQTEECLIELRGGDPRVKVINFSRNFGYKIAISAGMDFARGDAVVIIDADLQDSPELILDMIEKWKSGSDVVYAKRPHWKGETFFKKQTAAIFYRIFRRLTDIEHPIDTGDFRLMDRKVVDQIKNIREIESKYWPQYIVRDSYGLKHSEKMIKLVKAQFNKGIKL
jgi:polyisoprenyl-phosphate glycosyltransferase